MDILKVEWELSRVPIESRGGSNTCWKIGPMVACIYDDWRQRAVDLSEEDVAIAARAIQLVPEMVKVIESVADGDMYKVKESCREIVERLYPGEDG